MPPASLWSPNLLNLITAPIASKTMVPKARAENFLKSRSIPVDAKVRVEYFLIGGPILVDPKGRVEYFLACRQK